ncbi:uncharacterized protein [Physcomitrium patens]|uniref:Mitochondrial proton/calcium exchanger protein n=1 Tax=Physcomitrium patens TaxID=3218 RepID=A0A2K1JVE3_PHYPA|nr:mitochondrial proton/calcium exchanger protein-like [Physcomitrium patens]PNR45490.1 hypothetical protein PHYPA_015261 [Physcomitrium patens]|eukprot:XP_024389088.1 mitochondrial proton/calcium exchanger protein-like [Physcomitrella patens]
MGSRLLGIPRRRVLQLVETAETLLKPHQPSAASEPFLGPCRSSHLRRYTHQSHSGNLPTVLDRIVPRNEVDRTGLAANVKGSSIDVSGRSLYVQDGTIWKHGNVSGSTLRVWGQGPEGKRWLATYTRMMEEAARASNAATAVRYDEEEEVQSPKKSEKDPSPEDCDVAVEDLSSVKAKHKQSQEAPKTIESAKKPGDGWMVKVRNVIFGIGPAIRAIAAMSSQDWANKISGWKKAFWVELQHYWIGTKLLWADVKICSRLLLKLAGGKSLSRRERSQLTRTTADIFRLVPFAVFIIVPFMEFLLPVALKLFPNMLPSTFQDKMKEQEQLKKRLNARIQYAKFLQDTVGEMAKELKTSRSGDLRRKADDLDDFIHKVRTGGQVKNDDILSFAKLFNDELTLDNISRPRLVSMCKLMNIQPYGTDAYLRYSLRTKLQWIKEDDRMIQNEGVNSLSESELRQACRERGMLGLRSVEDMRKQLNDWLDLSLNHSLPSSLLILSRSFFVAGRSAEDAVQATLSSLPDEVIDSVGEKTDPGEEALAERRRKLEFLQAEEELIKAEEEKEKVDVDQNEKREKIADGSDEKDNSLREMMLATAREAQQLAKTKTSDKREELCKLSGALAVLASASSVSKERGEFLRLVKNEIELYNQMVEKEGTDGEEEARKAFYHAARPTQNHEEEDPKSPADHVSSALIERVDAMLHKLEKELDDVDLKIGDRWRILDRDYDGKVTPEEVAAAAAFLKDSLDKESVHELIANLAKDAEGKILVEDIVKLGTASEVIDGDLDVDIIHDSKVLKE